MEIDYETLDEVVTNIPLYPPLEPNGETTIKDLYPELTDKELEYIYSKYTGTMKLR